MIPTRNNSSDSESEQEDIDKIVKYHLPGHGDLQHKTDIQAVIGYTYWLMDELNDCYKLIHADFVVSKDTNSKKSKTSSNQEKTG